MEASQCHTPLFPPPLLLLLSSSVFAIPAILHISPFLTPSSLSHSLSPSPTYPCRSFRTRRSSVGLSLWPSSSAAPPFDALLDCYSTIDSKQASSLEEGDGGGRGCVRPSVRRPSRVRKNERNERAGVRGVRCLPLPPSEASSPPASTRLTSTPFEDDNKSKTGKTQCSASVAGVRQECECERKGGRQAVQATTAAAGDAGARFTVRWESCRAIRRSGKKVLCPGRGRRGRRGRKDAATTPMAMASHSRKTERQRDRESRASGVR